MNLLNLSRDQLTKHRFVKGLTEEQAEQKFEKHFLLCRVARDLILVRNAESGIKKRGMNHIEKDNRRKLE